VGRVGVGRDHRRRAPAVIPERHPLPRPTPEWYPSVNARQSPYERPSCHADPAGRMLSGARSTTGQRGGRLVAPHPLPSLALVDGSAGAVIAG
jgi:hypothetical protein